MGVEKKRNRTYACTRDRGVVIAFPAFCFVRRASGHDKGISSRAAGNVDPDASLRTLYLGCVEKSTLEAPGITTPPRPRCGGVCKHVSHRPIVVHLKGSVRMQWPRPRADCFRRGSVCDICVPRLGAEAGMYLRSMIVRQRKLSCGAFTYREDVNRPTRRSRRPHVLPFFSPPSFCIYFPYLK